MLRSIMMVLLCGVSFARAGEITPKLSAEDTVQIQVGTGLVCDSAKQVERFLTLYDGEDSSMGKTVLAVNKEAGNPKACGIASILFMSDQSMQMVKSANRMMHVVQIRIVATKTDKGWQRVPETVQYTALMEETQEI